MFFDADLATLDDVKSQLKIEATNDTAQDAVDDKVIQRLIRAASTMISQYTGRVFVPLHQTVSFDAWGDHIRATELAFGRDCFEIVTLTNGDGTVIPSAAYKLRPSTIYPKARVVLLASGGYGWTYSSDYEDAISIDAVWGYHEDYTRAWVSTLDVVKDASLSASATTITVNDADGIDAHYETRFKVGHYLKIDSEVVQVRVVTAGTTNTLTVLRGQLGTTAAIHAQNATISRWQVMPNVEKACIDLAGWMYRNAPILGDEIQVLNEGTKIITNKAPVTIAQTLDQYAVKEFFAG